MKIFNKLLREFKEELILNENNEMYPNEPEFHIENVTKEYSVEEHSYCVPTLETFIITFDDITLMLHNFSYENYNEEDYIRLGFNKNGSSFEIINKDKSVVFALGESEFLETYNDYFDEYDTYEEYNPDNCAIIRCGEINGYWDLDIVINKGQNYKEYNFYIYNQVVSVVKTNSVDEWKEKGYKFIDGVGYRFEDFNEYAGAYKLLTADDFI